jgi:hypothetical protein
VANILQRRLRRSGIIINSRGKDKIWKLEVAHIVPYGISNLFGRKRRRIDGLFALLEHVNRLRVVSRH